MAGLGGISTSIGGYVLAGGRSTRMGRDKALLELGGRSFVQHAVRKLQCLADEVFILSNRPEFATLAPLVPDLRESSGPLSGIEAALAHTSREWILVLPVYMPFLPRILLERWVHRTIEHPFARVALFKVEGVLQPALCLLHREVAPFVTKAAGEGRFKLYPVMDEATTALAVQLEVGADKVLLHQLWDDEAANEFLSSQRSGEKPMIFSDTQLAAKDLWFANLNTPEEFAKARLYDAALDI